MTDMQKMADGELVERVRAGGEEAFGVLFRRYEEEILRRIRRRLPQDLRRKVSSHDILQETCAAAFGRISGFEGEGEGAFGRWLAGIADHKLVDELRKINAGRRAFDREVPPDRRAATATFRSRDPSPSENAMRTERRDVLRRSLLRLPPHYREILSLVEDGGFTYREAGDRTGRGEDAARKLYGRALSRLTEIYDEETGRDRSGEAR